MTPILCDRIYDGSDLVEIGPGGLSRSGCISRCCTNPVRVQVRSRVHFGVAKICAPFVDPEEPDDYRTQSTTRITRKAYNGKHLVRTCVETIAHSVPDAIVSSGDPEEGVGCEEGSVDYSLSPDDCLDTLLDPPANSVTVDAETTYGGDTATVDDAKAAALGAMSAGEWSAWGDVIAVDPIWGLTPEGGHGGGIDLVLAEASMGGALPENLYTAWKIESEVRVLGTRPLALTIASGTGDLASMTLSVVTVTPGTPHSFSVAVSTSGTQPQIWLRCVCPPHLAALA